MYNFQKQSTLSIYLDKVSKKYNTRLKTIVDLDNKDHFDLLEKILVRYGLLSMTTPRKTVWHDRSRDFPNLGYGEIWYVDIETKLKPIDVYLSNELGEMFSVPESYFKLIDPTYQGEIDDMVANIENVADEKNLTYAPVMGSDPSKDIEIDMKNRIGKRFLDKFIADQISKMNDNPTQSTPIIAKKLFSFLDLPKDSKKPNGKKLNDPMISANGNFQNSTEVTKKFYNPNSGKVIKIESSDTFTQPKVVSENINEEIVKKKLKTNYYSKDITLYINPTIVELQQLIYEFVEVRGYLFEDKIVWVDGNEFTHLNILQSYDQTKDWKDNSWRHLTLIYGKKYFELTASERALSDPRVKEILHHKEFILKNNLSEKFNDKLLRQLYNKPQKYIKTLGNLELIKNPTTNEFISLLKDYKDGLRGIYDPKNNDVYFWDENSKYIHDDILDYLDWPTNDLSVSFYVEKKPLRISTYEETGKYFKQMLRNNESFKAIINTLNPKFIIDTDTEISKEELL